MRLRKNLLKPKKLLKQLLQIIKHKQRKSNTVVSDYKAAKEQYKSDKADYDKAKANYDAKLAEKALADKTNAELS